MLDRQPGAYNEVSGFSPTGAGRPADRGAAATVQVMSGDVQGIEERIRHAFFADLFLMLAMSDRRQITATEVLERHEEKMLVLGPVLTRLSSELLSSVIERLFATIIRASAPLWPDAGIVPPPPAELGGQDLAIDYTSTLFAAQKAMQVGPMQQWVSLTDQIAATQPEALDKRNADAMVEHYADLLGVSPKVYRGDGGRGHARSPQAQMAAQRPDRSGRHVDQARVGEDEGTRARSACGYGPAPEPGQARRRAGRSRFRLADHESAAPHPLPLFLDCGPHRPAQAADQLLSRGRRASRRNKAVGYFGAQPDA
jgi:hypothetical protein